MTTEPDNEDRGKDCAWCGGYRFVTFSNRNGEDFCCKSCRDASNRALKRLTDSEPQALHHRYYEQS